MNIEHRTPNIERKTFGDRISVSFSTCGASNAVFLLNSWELLFTGVKSYSESGMSMAGLRGKKLNGFNSNSPQAKGIMGQSSLRTTWWNPKVYQTTMSVLAMGRFALV